MSVPTLSREEFHDAIGKVGCAFVWVDVCESLQKRVRISVREAIEIVDEASSFGRFWGQIVDGEVEIGLPSQWKGNEDERERNGGRAGERHPCR